jgi:hypothetical protein
MHQLFLPISSHTAVGLYRVVNFPRALTPDGPDRDDKLAIAVAFHDVAAFDTLDYLMPSIEAWSDELALVSQGLIRFGLPSSYVKEVRAAFDATDFFRRVIPAGALRAVRRLQQPGFLRPANALLRSGHGGAAH